MKRATQAEYNKIVVYIGAKSPKYDRVYGTEEVMYPGDTIEVISDVANEMVKARGVYTFPGSPAFNEFVAANPELAVKKGLVDTDALVASQAELKTPVQRTDLDQTPVEPVEKEPTDDATSAPEGNADDAAKDAATSAIDEIIAELDALPSKPAIQAYCDANELGIKLDGTRDDYLEQVRAKLMEDAGL